MSPDDSSTHGQGPVFYFAIPVRAQAEAATYGAPEPDPEALMLGIGLRDPCAPEPEALTTCWCCPGDPPRICCGEPRCCFGGDPPQQAQVRKKTVIDFEVIIEVRPGEEPTITVKRTQRVVAQRTCEDPLDPPEENVRPIVGLELERFLAECGQVGPHPVD